MKYLIASDIHGSEVYCKKIVDAFEAEGADTLVLLGDILYHGPRNDLPEIYAPKGVIEMLNALKDRIIAVRGNCDAEVDQMVLDFPIMADYALIESGDKTVFATHGHKYNPSHPPALSNVNVLLNGHTHVVAEGEEFHAGDATLLYYNPGSVSIPKDGRRGYLLLEDGVFRWRSIS